MHRRRHGHRRRRGGDIAVRIAQAVLDAIAGHAQRSLPRECCGVLLGREQAIVEAVGITNVARDVHRYLLDPAEHIAARREARLRALDVVGFYHSHPDSEPEPSATDLQEASYSGHLYLIVRPGPGAPKVRLFLLEGAVFRELGFVVERRP